MGDAPPAVGGAWCRVPLYTIRCGGDSAGKKRVRERKKISLRDGRSSSGTGTCPRTATLTLFSIDGQLDPQRAGEGKEKKKKRRRLPQAPTPPTFRSVRRGAGRENRRREGKEKAPVRFPGLGTLLPGSVR